MTLKVLVRHQTDVNESLLKDDNTDINDADTEEGEIGDDGGYTSLLSQFPITGAEPAPEYW